jgi:hypothetical protein
MEINGLPLHVLVVHAAVVLTPLAALLALAYLAPRWRDRLRLPLLVAGLVAAGIVVLAYLSGDDFLGSDRFDFLATSPDLKEKVDHHADLGRIALWVGLGFGAVCVASWWCHDRTERAVRLVLDALLAIAAVALLVVIVMTGDAGAQAVWGK